MEGSDEIDGAGSGEDDGAHAPLLDPSTGGAAVLAGTAATAPMRGEPMAAPPGEDDEAGDAGSQKPATDAGESDHAAIGNEEAGDGDAADGEHDAVALDDAATDDAVAEEAAPGEAATDGPAPDEPARQPDGQGDQQRTEVLPAVDDQDDGATQVLPPVVAPASPTPPEGAETSEAVDEDAGEPEVDREWMGIASFVTGALLLSPVAIVLGHLGLSAANKGRARHRSFALAGAILGWVGLVALGLGAYFLLAEGTSPEEIDVQAQQDVSALGAAAATVAVETGAAPEIDAVTGGYSVGGATIVSELSSDSTMTYRGTTASDWCLDLTFDGGTVEAYRYTATEGMSEGSCADLE
ncbi:DUF4190 domain-containing protein [Demequina sp. NBRC 110053]|uniref:DUF4190 domain-containing protein n=1 Tax=Demequina sp. NBRC 110053 TaxID=1570342 RepID=UPI0009FED330|nr:DUF4190 domain-containing protein [Demequina sp. NBRC 110053]